MQSDEIRKVIREQIDLVSADLDCEIVDDISDETVLLETGLDSLGFAMLVVQLEEVFGRDPFLEIDEAVYPTTFGEFIQIYVKFFGNM